MYDCIMKRVFDQIPTPTIIIHNGTTHPETNFFVQQTTLPEYGAHVLLYMKLKCYFMHGFSTSSSVFYPDVRKAPINFSNAVAGGVNLVV
jgi:hypothetical protein